MCLKMNERNTEEWKWQIKQKLKNIIIYLVALIPQPGIPGTKDFPLVTTITFRLNLELAQL